MRNLVKMNKVKHVTNSQNQKIGTLVVSMNKDNSPVFGWSRYNVSKEKDRFSRRAGRYYAELSTTSGVDIDIPNNLMFKDDGEILVQDKYMVRGAIIFINDIKNSYGIYPINVCVHDHNFFEVPLGELIGENQLLKSKCSKLQEDLYKLQKTYLQKDAEYMSTIFSAYSYGKKIGKKSMINVKEEFC